MPRTPATPTTTPRPTEAAERAIAAYHLHAVLGYSYRQIGRVLGVSYVTAFRAVEQGERLSRPRRTSA